MKEFYLAIRAHLLTAVPELKTIGMWNSQLDFIDSGEQIPFLFPALFVDFSNIEFSGVGDKSQKMEIEMSLHICSEFYNGDRQEENLIVFDLKEKVYNALYTRQFDNSTALVRLREMTDITHRSVYHYIQIWSLDLVTTSPDQWTELENVNVNIDAQREIENYDIMTKKQYPK